MLPLFKQTQKMTPAFSKQKMHSRWSIASSMIWWVICLRLSLCKVKQCAAKTADDTMYLEFEYRLGVNKNSTKIKKTLMFDNGDAWMWHDWHIDEFDDSIHPLAPLNTTIQKANAELALFTKGKALKHSEEFTWCVEALDAKEVKKKSPWTAKQNFDKILDQVAREFFRWSTPIICNAFTSDTPSTFPWCYYLAQANSVVGTASWNPPCSLVNYLPRKLLNSRSVSAFLSYTRKQL